MGHTRWRHPKAGLAILSLHLLARARLGAEDRFDYRFEYYSEERHRIQVQTHTGLFEQDVASWLTLRGSVVYDGISGATPKGGPPVAGNHQVDVKEIKDKRYAGAFEGDLKFGRHTLRPGLALSYENDYESVAPSLNYLVDFNQRKDRKSVV